MGLVHSEGVHEKLSEWGKPAETWSNDPNGYFIVRSDLVEEEQI